MSAARMARARERWNLDEVALAGVSDWPVKIAQAGLSHRASKSFLIDLPAPLAPEARSSVTAERVALHRDVRASLAAVDPADAAALDRLVDPDDEFSAYQRPDLIVLSTTIAHLAVLG